jgi:hypothetical protein
MHLVPHRIEDRETDGEAEAEYPTEVPHVICPIIAIVPDREDHKAAILGRAFRFNIRDDV